MKKSTVRLNDAKFNAFGIGYTEQLRVTGGRCVVECTGWTKFDDGSTEYDLLYTTTTSDGGYSLEAACGPDIGSSPYNRGDIVAVYP